MNTTKLPYRQGVGIMLLNQENRVFVGQRIDTRAEAWQMPQGGIDSGESPKEAALRELEEEVGTNLVTIIYESKQWYIYDLPEDIKPKVWNGKYQGQSQRWFAMRFHGTDDNINIHTNEPEFHNWKWTKLDDLPKLIVPFKQRLYQELIEEFKPHLI